MEKLVRNMLSNIVGHAAITIIWFTYFCCCKINQYTMFVLLFRIFFMQIGLILFHLDIFASKIGGKFIQKFSSKFLYINI